MAMVLGLDYPVVLGHTDVVIRADTDEGEDDD